MCDYSDLIKSISFNSELSDEEKELLIREETDKELMLDFLDENDDLGILISDLGINKEDLYNKDYMWSIEDDDYTFNQVNENFRTIKLYKYMSRTYGSAGIGSNTRRFCRTLVSRTDVSLMRFEDIDRLNGSNPGFGKGGSSYYSVFNWRGGVNCKHQWVKFIFDTTTNNLVKVPNNEQPLQVTVSGKVPYANGTNSPSKD